MSIKESPPNKALYLAIVDEEDNKVRTFYLFNLFNSNVFSF